MPPVFSKSRQALRRRANFYKIALAKPLISEPMMGVDEDYLSTL
jgi:hypothetical protein